MLPAFVSTAGILLDPKESHEGPAAVIKAIHPLDLWLSRKRLVKNG